MAIGAVRGFHVHCVMRCSMVGQVAHLSVMTKWAIYSLLIHKELKLNFTHLFGKVPLTEDFVLEEKY